MQNETDQVLHSYSVDLNLHHPSADPGEITKALATEPWFARKKGEFVGEIQNKFTSWLCHFQKGAGNEEFNRTLENLVSFLSMQRSFLSKFTEEEGTVEVVLNATVPVDEGKLFDLRLDPFLLRELSQRNVSLRVQVWNA
jgi:Domain of unknown function (DUF4279)